jgi:hypothetical protein
MKCKGFKFVILVGIALLFLLSFLTVPAEAANGKDNKVPDIHPSLSPESPTNGNVIVDANASDEDSGIKLVEYGPGILAKKDFSEGGTAGSSFTAEANGVWTFYAEDNAGNFSIRKVHVGNIDKTAPSVSACPDGGTYYREQSVSLSTEQDAVIYYTLNGEIPGRNSSVYTGPVTINTSCTLKYVAIDQAGNQSPLYSKEYTILLPKITKLALSAPDASGIASSPDSFPVQVNMETNTLENILYQVWVEDTDGWVLKQEFTPFTGVPYVCDIRKTESDEYRVHVRIKGSDTGTVYDQKSTVASYTQLGGVTLEKIVTDTRIEGKGEKGVPVNITAYPYHASYRYRFEISKDGQAIVTTDFAADNTYQWIPQEMGTYKILVRVQDSDGTQTAATDIELKVVDNAYVYAELRDLQISGAKVGEPVILTTNSAPGNSSLEYRFMAGEEFRGLMTLASYGAASSTAWIPEKSGIYRVEAYARDNRLREYEDRIINNTYRVVKDGIGPVTLSVGRSVTDSEIPVNSAVAFTAAASGENAQGLEYSFWRFEARGWTLIQDYSAENTLDWSPAYPGVYGIVVRVRHSQSGSYEDQKYFSYRVTDSRTSDIQIDSLAIQGTGNVRENHVISVEASGKDREQTHKLMYSFKVVSDQYGWKTLQKYAPYPTCNWQPKKAGVYTIIAWVKDPVSGSFEQEMKKTVTID